MEPKYVRFDRPFELECGGSLPEVTIAYHTYGTLSPEKDNVIWVCHALTANSEVADWWPHTVEEGKFLDPAKYFVVCANMIGSQYGSTGSLSTDPATGKPYYRDFPELTNRDVVRGHMLLADHLGISRVKMMIGSSIGGFQALEWLIMYPDFAKGAALICTSPKVRPWVIAFNESQRMAIEADGTFGEPRDDAGAEGMKTARSIALLSYRGPSAYNATQMELDKEEKTKGFRAASYQRHQGWKLANRFSAYTYYLLTRLVDTHDVGRKRGGVERALGGVKASCVVIGVTSDILFPPEENRFMAEHIPGARFETIESDFGHDGFLVEHEKLNRILRDHLDKL